MINEEDRKVLIDSIHGLIEKIKVSENIAINVVFVNEDGTHCITHMICNHMVKTLMISETVINHHKFLDRILKMEEETGSEHKEGHSTSVN